jgi:predicted metal-dependent hydrolase
MPRTDLQEVTTRNKTARYIVAGFSAATPTLTEAWRHVEAALNDTPAMVREVRRLRTELARTRLGRANLAAAALATFAALREGEGDPLLYLRDELHAQGYDVEQGRA